MYTRDMNTRGMYTRDMYTKCVLEYLLVGAGG